MCTCGGPTDICDVTSLATKNYECQDCGNKFKGMGHRPVCPSCQSRNIKSA